MGSYDLDMLSGRMWGWFLEADTDLKAFDKLINEDNEDLRLRSLFHLQQAAEKMGKAMVIFHGIFSCEIQKLLNDEVKKKTRKARLRPHKAFREIFEQMNRLCKIIPPRVVSLVLLGLSLTSRTPPPSRTSGPLPCT